MLVPNPNYPNGALKILDLNLLNEEQVFALSNLGGMFDHNLNVVVPLGCVEGDSIFLDSCGYLRLNKVQVISVNTQEADAYSARIHDFAVWHSQRDNQGILHGFADHSGNLPIPSEINLLGPNVIFSDAGIPLNTIHVIVKGDLVYSATLDERVDAIVRDVELNLYFGYNYKNVVADDSDDFQVRLDDLTNFLDDADEFHSMNSESWDDPSLDQWLKEEEARKEEYRLETFKKFGWDENTFENSFQSYWLIHHDFSSLMQDLLSQIPK